GSQPEPSSPSVSTPTERAPCQAPSPLRTEPSKPLPCDSSRPSSTTNSASTSFRAGAGYATTSSPPRRSPCRDRRRRVGVSCSCHSCRTSLSRSACCQERAMRRPVTCSGCFVCAALTRVHREGARHGVLVRRDGCSRGDGRGGGALGRG